jgi:glutathione S-transferase
MKLYEEPRAPNPRRVHIFLAEKGIAVPRVSIDINKMEHKTPEFAALNPFQRTPTLQLDDGTVIAESIAVCRYFEEVQPDPPLFGIGAVGKALVEMWQRRIEFGLLLTVAAAFRHLHPAMAQMEVPQVTAWGEANKPKAIEFLQVLDGQLADSQFVCGDAFTVADITGLVAVDFMRPAKITLPEELANVRRWHSVVSERSSARA